MIEIIPGDLSKFRNRIIAENGIGIIVQRAVLPAGSLCTG